MLSHLPTEDNLCQLRVTVKCQEALVGMDVVNQGLIQVGIRVKDRVTASATATRAIKVNYNILLACLLACLPCQHNQRTEQADGP